MQTKPGSCKTAVERDKLFIKIALKLKNKVIKCCRRDPGGYFLVGGVRTAFTHTSFQSEIWDVLDKNPIRHSRLAWKTTNLRPKWSKQLKTYTLWGGTYLYSLYRGETRPPLGQWITSWSSCVGLHAVVFFFFIYAAGIDFACANNWIYL